MDLAFTSPKIKSQNNNAYMYTKQFERIYTFIDLDLWRAYMYLFSMSPFCRNSWGFFKKIFFQKKNPKMGSDIRSGPFITHDALPINNYVSNHVKGVRVRQWGIYTVILFLCRQMELTWYCSLFSVLWSPDGLHNLLSLSSGEVPTLAPVNWVHRTRETRNDAAINEGTTLITVALKTLEPQHEEAETNSPYLGNMKEKEKKRILKKLSQS